MWFYLLLNYSLITTARVFFFWKRIPHALSAPDEKAINHRHWLFLDVTCCLWGTPRRVITATRFIYNKYPEIERRMWNLNGELLLPAGVCFSQLLPAPLIEAQVFPVVTMTPLVGRITEQWTCLDVLQQKKTSLGCESVFHFSLMVMATQPQPHPPVRTMALDLTFNLLTRHGSHVHTGFFFISVPIRTSYCLQLL